jgi:ParB family chromosome partitioning protein
MKKRFTAIKEFIRIMSLLPLTRVLSVDDITTIPELANIFPIGKDTLREITESMKQNGFDNTQPITAFNYHGKVTVIDGHTRLQAARNAGIKRMFVIVEEFDDLEDAKLYAYKRQRVRRNLTQAEIFKAAANLQLKDGRDGSGRSVDQASRALGVSSATITHAKTVNERASEDDKEAIQRGEKTINEVYKTVKRKKPQKPNKTETRGMADVSPAGIKSETLTEEGRLTISSKDNEVTGKAVETEGGEKMVYIPEILGLLLENGEHKAASLISDRYDCPLPESS